MTKLIKNWEELAAVPANDTYKIIVSKKGCNGWIVPVEDEISEKDYFVCNCEKGKDIKEWFDHHVYLSTHTFYGSQYKYSTKILQEHGFDIEIDNWDKERKI